MLNIRNFVVSTAVVAALGVGVTSTAFAGPDKDHKSSVCHYKGNGDAVVISVAQQAVPAHMAHGDTPADAYGDCP